jgi:hypothetical protein
MLRVCSDSFRQFFLMLLLSASCTTGAIAAQLPDRDKDTIARMIAVDIDHEITKHGKGHELREKAVRRLSECIWLYYVLSVVKASDPEMQTRFKDAGDITSRIATLISAEISSERFKELADAGKANADDMLRRDDRKGGLLLMRSCKSFSEPSEINEAVNELTF